jgi:predicted Holliday junction resolvase-like endonuclease
MDIISFGLGISSVVVIILILVTVHTFVKLEKLKEKVNSLETDYPTRFEDILRTIDQNCELDNRRIDGEIDRTDKLVEDVYRTIDSRLDKLEARLTDSNKSKN